MTYFDTSYLVKCYLPERGSAEVRRFAATQDAIACSAFGRVELVAALHRKLREGTLDAAGLAIVLEQLATDDAHGLWTWLPVTDRQLRDTANKLATLPAHVFIRSADALHLTCEAGEGCSSMFSNDTHLLAAAPHFGVRGENVIGRLKRRISKTHRICRPTFDSERCPP